jgi:hypothetical protein
MVIYLDSLGGKFSLAKLLAVVTAMCVWLSRF